MAKPRVRFLENVIKRRVEERDKFFSDLVGKLLEGERDDDVCALYIWAIGELGQKKAVPSLHNTIFKGGTQIVEAMDGIGDAAGHYKPWVLCQLFTRDFCNRHN